MDSPYGSTLTIGCILLTIYSLIITLVASILLCYAYYFKKNQAKNDIRHVDQTIKSIDCIDRRSKGNTYLVNKMPLRPQSVYDSIKCTSSTSKGPLYEPVEDLTKNPKYDLLEILATTISSMYQNLNQEKKASTEYYFTTLLKIIQSQNSELYRILTQCKKNEKGVFNEIIQNDSDSDCCYGVHTGNIKVDNNKTEFDRLYMEPKPLAVTKELGPGNNIKENASSLKSKTSAKRSQSIILRVQMVEETLRKRNESISDSEIL